MDVYIAVNESFEEPPDFSLDFAGSLFFLEFSTHEL